MTITKTGHAYAVTCDECGDVWEGGEDFVETVEEVKEAGWKVDKDGWRWTHTCDGCRDDEPGETPLERARRMFG